AVEVARGGHGPSHLLDPEDHTRRTREGRPKPASGRNNRPTGPAIPSSSVPERNGLRESRVVNLTAAREACYNPRTHDNKEVGHGRPWSAGGANPDPLAQGRAARGHSDFPRATLPGEPAGGELGGRRRPDRPGAARAVAR